MNSFSHLFVIDPLEKLNKKLDSSIRMAFSLSRRGHNIYIATPKDISWSMDAGVARLKAQALNFNKDNFSSLKAAAPVDMLKAFRLRCYLHEKRSSI